MNQGVLAIAIIALGVGSGASFVIYDAIFHAGDIVMGALCKSYENIKDQGWRERGTNLCSTYNETVSWIKSNVNSG